MAYFRFTASRSIAAGYAAGDVVDVSVKCSSVEPDLEIFKETHIPYDRSNRFHVVTGEEIKTDIVTGPIVGKAANDLMRMFIDSVKDGSTFLADIDSNVASSLTSHQLTGRNRKPQLITDSIRVYRFTVVAL